MLWEKLEKARHYIGSIHYWSWLVLAHKSRRYVSILNSMVNDVYLVACDQSWKEYLHHVAVDHLLSCV